MSFAGNQVANPAGQVDPAVAAAVMARQWRPAPGLAMVLGSGFQSLLGEIKEAVVLDYAQLPGFPAVRVPGHSGELVMGLLAGVPVAVLGGRAHFYEGYTMGEITYPIRVLAAWGVRSVLLTNAAGAINPKMRPGDFMCLKDHVNFMGANPLVGTVWSGPGSFVDLTEVYDREMRGWLAAAARRSKIRLWTGVYLAVSGPSYETPAEIKAFARWGTDAVGMSTVPEAIVARQCGLRVAGLSCITNAAAGRSRRPLSHEEVLAKASVVRVKAVRLLREFAVLSQRG